MPKYLISVWHDDSYEVDFSTPEAQRRAAHQAARQERDQPGLVGSATG